MTVKRERERERDDNPNEVIRGRDKFKSSLLDETFIILVGPHHIAGA
jgi:hypothetical protein